MKSVNPRWENTNKLYVFLLVAAGLVWFAQLHTFGIAVGLTACVIGYFMFQRNRWAYFAAAVWCFGLLRIAMDDDYGFYGDIGSYVKLPYVFGVVMAIILHEKVAIKGDTKNQGVEEKESVEDK